MARPRTILDYLKLSADYLAGKGIPSARLDAEILLGHVLEKDRVHLYVHFDQPLQVNEVDAYRTLIARRAGRIPVAYLTGEKEFFSRSLSVRPGVLVPRPETELLIEHVVEWAKERGPLTLVDVGTGSGAIAVTLALELPQAIVLATDVSPEALKVARANAAELGVGERVHFHLGPWLAPLRDTMVDAVVSNPPYIPSRQIETLEPEVRVHEPRLALDGGPDGLDAYRALIPQAAAQVGPGGLLALEVGAGQAESVAQLGQAAGWEWSGTYKDHAQIDRVVTMRRGDA